ncbi:MAG TPA: YoaK family protein, partial [Mycobacterium sp.]|nr:YoaK family protein [Mycobacterium sp.]
MGGSATRPHDVERTRSLWFALLLTLANGFLDAYTYIVRGGVFANVQTANVIFFAIDSSERKWASALAHVWPLLAFIAGVGVASYIKSGRIERLVPRPLPWVMAVQAVVLAVIGFVPLSVPHSYVTIPISFLAAMQISLFRNVGELVYLPVATTGNLMRFVEAG